MTAQYVLDVSALLALLRGETGWQVVAAIRRESVVGLINYAETLQVLMRIGFASADAREIVEKSEVQLAPFDHSDAVRVAELEAPTRPQGLSLGDRACLALALRLGIPAVTAEKSWSAVTVGATVNQIR